VNALDWTTAAGIVDQHFCLRFSLALLHFLWQGAVIGLLVLVAGWSLGRAPSRVRYAVALAAMLLMVACIPVTFALLPASSKEMPESPAAGAAAGVALRQPPVVDPTSRDATPEFRSPRAEATYPVAAVIESQFEPASTIEAEPATTKLAGSFLATLASWATAAYLLGVVIMLLRLGVALRGGHRLKRYATPVDDQRLLQLIAEQARRLGLRSAPAVAYCRRVAVPVVVGIVKPTVLLPVSLATGLAADQLEAILAHELAHVRRFDLVVNLLQRVVESLLFFHPAVWYVSRRVTIERENCCDDYVVASGHERFRYADALIRMAELCGRGRVIGAAGPAAALAATGQSPSHFKRRVMRLLDSEPRLRLTRGGTVILLLLILLLAAAPVAVQRWRNRAVADEVATPAKEEDEGADREAETEAARPAPFDDPFAHQGATQADAAEDDAGGSALEIEVLDLYGQPIEQCTLVIWRSLAEEEEPGEEDWQDPATQRTWRRAKTGRIRPAKPGEKPTDGTTRVSGLPAGTYRVVATSSGTPTITPVSFSEPFELDGNEQRRVPLRMHVGGNVRFEVLDAADGGPLLDPGVWLEGKPKTLPPEFLAIPRRDGNVNTFEHLPAGEYQFSVFRSALSPDALEYDLNKDLGTVEVAEGETAQVQLALKGRPLTEKEIASRWPWIVSGTVTDAQGNGIEGATVRALVPPLDEVLGSATTDAHGGYTFRMTALVRVPDEQTTQNFQTTPRFLCWEVVIAASKPGYAERNLNRQGALHCAYRLPPDEYKGPVGTPRFFSLSSSSDVDPDRLLLPEKPHTVDFILVPAVDVKVKLLDARNRPEEEARLFVRSDATSPDDLHGLGRATDDRGECVFSSLAPNYPWWFRIHAASGVVATPPMKFASPGRYTVHLAPRVDPATGLDRLRVVSIIDSQGTEVKDRVVGYDALEREQPDAALQARGLAILRKVREVNRYWLGIPPAAVKHFRYVLVRQGADREVVRVGMPVPLFEDEGLGPYSTMDDVVADLDRRFLARKAADRDVIRVGVPAQSTLFERRGIAYHSAIDQIVRDLDNVIVRQLEVGSEQITLGYALKLPIYVQLGMSVGWSTTSWAVSAGTLVIDATTHTLVEHRAEGLAGRLREKLSQYVEIRQGYSVPLRISLNFGDHEFRDRELKFRVHHPGLWLFERAWRKGAESEPLAHVEHLSVNTGLSYEHLSAGFRRRAASHHYEALAAGYTAAEIQRDSDPDSAFASIKHGGLPLVWHETIIGAASPHWRRSMYHSALRDKYLEAAERPGLAIEPDPPPPPPPSPLVEPISPSDFSREILPFIKKNDYLMLRPLVFEVERHARILALTDEFLSDEDRRRLEKIQE
jgi:beta-lactamase regulating signal transducer with metallopeptidase domain